MGTSAYLATAGSVPSVAVMFSVYRCCFGYRISYFRYNQSHTAFFFPVLYCVSYVVS